MAGNKRVPFSCICFDSLVDKQRGVPPSSMMRSGLPSGPQSRAFSVHHQYSTSTPRGSRPSKRRRRRSYVRWRRPRGLGLRRYCRTTSGLRRRER
ncbi:hypothetical protein WN943_024847 [Citrus x changshan-huyou]